MVGACSVQEEIARITSRSTERAETTPRAD
jgi:hypothetical protein